MASIGGADLDLAGITLFADLNSSELEAGGQAFEEEFVEKRSAAHRKRLAELIAPLGR